MGSAQDEGDGDKNDERRDDDSRGEFLGEQGPAQQFPAGAWKNIPQLELCHALVGEKGELAAIDYALEEIAVESATYVACAAAGLETDVDSVPYVAGWAGDQDPLQVVAEAAALIDELARLIEDAIAPADVDEHDEPDASSAEAAGEAARSAA